MHDPSSRRTCFPRRFFAPLCGLLLRTSIGGDSERSVRSGRRSAALRSCIADRSQPRAAVTGIVNEIAPDCVIGGATVRARLSASTRPNCAAASRRSSPASGLKSSLLSLRYQRPAEPASRSRTPGPPPFASMKSHAGGFQCSAHLVDAARSRVLADSKRLIVFRCRLVRLPREDRAVQCSSQAPLGAPF